MVLDGKNALIDGDGGSNRRADHARSRGELTAVGDVAAFAASDHCARSDRNRAHHHAALRPTGAGGPELAGRLRNRSLPPVCARRPVRPLPARPSQPSRQELRDSAPISAPRKRRSRRSRARPAAVSWYRRPAVSRSLRTRPACSQRRSASCRSASPAGRSRSSRTCSAVRRERSAPQCTAVSTANSICPSGSPVPIL